MEGVTLQACLAIVMFLTTFIAGLVPLKLLRYMAKQGAHAQRRHSWVLTLLSCFAGGVFLGTCFLDIFPHVNGNFDKYKDTYGWKFAYPLPEFLACMGFFLVYFFEEISLKVFSSHGHTHGPAPPPQSFTPSVGQNEKSNGVNGSTTVDVAEIDDEGYPVDRKFSGVEPYPAVLTHEHVMDESVRYVNSDSANGGILKSITFAFVMSFHSILEGFALGVQEEKSGIITLFISLIIHKGIEAFSVGLQVSRGINSSKKKKKILANILTICIYALMTPVGSMLGVLLTTWDIDPIKRDLFVIILEGCAAGTFIYVTFFEVLAQEKANDHSNLIQLAAIVLGFACIALLQLQEHLGGDGHGHAHG
ncbi:unnamed protein product [Bursaphelenchus xylophilus]|uniref:(pine wood nematode) hypothetical protein n=1 Tax=Bursaphelenchus xylophilus TaxID=6326 RepID=A0A1I7SFJ3_BURXY|nr:unnamed protein product [Bursaphelenchus xylophilus]CAG9079123.1 unnamed protein product [Bursaphelenchus xylophilus]